jgi:hypothetical protein
MTTSTLTFGRKSTTEIDDVLGAAVEFGVPLLPAEALDLGHGKAADSNFRERLPHFVELEWLEYRLDFLHERTPSRTGVVKDAVG